MRDALRLRKSRCRLRPHISGTITSALRGAQTCIRSCFYSRRRVVLVVRWWPYNPTLKHISYNGVGRPPSTSAYESQVKKGCAAIRAYKTAFTTSRMTAPLEISIFSTPCKPSARVGPRLRSRTGLCSSSACLSSLAWNEYRCLHRGVEGVIAPEC